MSTSIERQQRDRRRGGPVEFLERLPVWLAPARGVSPDRRVGNAVLLAYRNFFTAAHQLRELPSGPG